MAPWAESLATLGFGFHLDHRIRQARKAFDQLTTFNRIDPVEAGEAFLEAVEPFRADDTSPAGKWSVVRMLYATGREDHAREACAIGDELHKDRNHRFQLKLPAVDFPAVDFAALRRDLNLPGIRRGLDLPGNSLDPLEIICATDPCGPGSERPENVDPTIQGFSEIETDRLLTTMSKNQEDMDFEKALCAVSRFGPETAVAKGREFCRSILWRVGMPLRQPALNGTSFAPLLERDDALDLSRRLQDTLPKNDVKIIKDCMTMFSMHQLNGDEQLELLTSESLKGRYLIDCIPGLKRPSEQAVLEKPRAVQQRCEFRVQRIVFGGAYL